MFGPRPAASDSLMVPGWVSSSTTLVIMTTPLPLRLSAAGREANDERPITPYAKSGKFVNDP